MSINSDLKKPDLKRVTGYGTDMDLRISKLDSDGYLQTKFLIFSHFHATFQEGSAITDLDYVKFETNNS